MDISIQHLEQGVTVIAFNGRLDFLSAGDARSQLAATVKDGHRKLIADLGTTSFLDSSGIGALIGGLKAARQAGGDLRIARPGEQATSVFALTSLDRVFRQFATVEEASSDY